MTRSKTLSLGLGIVLLLPGFAHARPRTRHEDAIVVERSELIVIGHLKEGSIKYVPHQRKRGFSYEHHATLVVTEVTKGTCDEKQIAVILHYGLDPRVGGTAWGCGSTPRERQGRKHSLTGPIYILDTGSGAGGAGSLVKDAREDNLWLLRKRTDRWGKEHSNPRMLGIVDSDDLQPLSLKPYFLAYLAEDPERAVREQLEKSPAIGRRARQYLDHLEIQRILAVPDPRIRVARLLPFFVRDFRWGATDEAGDGLAACGDVARHELIKVFRETDRDLLRRREASDGAAAREETPGSHLFGLHEEAERWIHEFEAEGARLRAAERAEWMQGIRVSLRDSLRRNIVALLGKMRCGAAVPFLVDLLKKHDEHWKQEMAKPDWKSDNAYKSGANLRAYDETYAALWALLPIGDPRARGVIEQTQRRWKAINFRNPQILQACEYALEALAAREKEHSSAPSPADRRPRHSERG